MSITAAVHRAARFHYNGAMKPGPAMDHRMPDLSKTSVPANPDREQTTVCPNCAETEQLAKVKGCIRCLRCGFKFDCNGW